MHEIRRNSDGVELPPRTADSPTYDDKLAGIVEAIPVDAIEVFLNRWFWRGPRDVVKRELLELMEAKKAGGQCGI